MGVVLQHTKNVLAVNVAGVQGIFFNPNVNHDGILQLDVPICRFDFKNFVAIFLTALNDDLAELAAAGHRIEDGGIGFFGNMASHIVDPGFLVTGSGEPITVGHIADTELDMLEHFHFGGRFGVNVGENLGQIQAKGKHMAIVDQSIVVFGGGTLPSHNNFVIVASFTVDKAIVGIDGCSVGDPQGVVGVAFVQVAVDIGAAAVDLCQTCFGNVNGHVPIIGAVGDSKAAIVLQPGR